MSAGRSRIDPAPLVLVHGWGCGAGAFDAVAEALAARRVLWRPDLPGYGRNRPDAAGADLAAIAADVLERVDGPAHWVGWSLGGLVALEVARRAPQRVRRVTLVAASPRMTAAPGWPGIDPGALEGFRRALAAAPARAHVRFLAFQLWGSERARTALRRLRAAAADDPPEVTALSAGLELLARVDLRATAAALPCRVDALLGEQDPLVPAAVEPGLADHGIGVRVIPGAGHAPFASHPDAFVEALLE